MYFLFFLFRKVGVVGSPTAPIVFLLLSLEGLLLFFSMAQGYFPSSSSATSLFAEKGNLENACLYSLFLLARK